MWKKIKIIGISIGIVTLAVLSFIFGSRSNRSGVQPDNGLPDRIREGNQTVEDGLSDLDRGIGKGAEKSRDITKRAVTIEAKLGTAIEVLRAAKEKNKSNMGG